MSDLVKIKEGVLPRREQRYEIIVRLHDIEHTEHGSIKSRRYNLYQRVITLDDQDVVIAAIDSVLNSERKKS